MNAKEAALAARDLIAGYDAEKPTLMADALRALWLRGVPSAAPELGPGQQKLMSTGPGWKQPSPGLGGASRRRSVFWKALPNKSRRKARAFRRG
jgi:hypothetical protein